MTAPENPPAEPQGTIDMTATDSAVLAGCPFCGGEAAQGGYAIAVDGYWCACQECGVYRDGYKTPAEAIAAWNRRTESADDALLRSLSAWLAWVDSDLDEIVADGGITAAMVVQQEARGQRRRIDAHLSRPRPARDDALEEADLTERLAFALYEEHVAFIDDKDAFEWADLPAPVKQSWINSAARRLAPVTKYLPLAALKGQKP